MSLSNRRAMLGSALKGMPNNEIWYTNGSTTTKTEPNKTDAFGVGIISNTYDVIHKCWRLKFNGKVTTIGTSAFLNCDSLTSVTIPGSVTEIGEDAFNYCRSLTSVNIPDSVTTIGDDAFFNCSSLTSITIPDSVTTIGHAAFYGCAGELIVNCNIPSASYSSDGTFYGSKFTSVTIGDSVPTIGDWAFYFCDSLTSVTIPDSVTSIGSSAFRDCSSLISVTIPNSVTAIGGYAFYECSSLTSVTIGDSVTTIGGYAFYNCSNLTSITIGDSVTTIKTYAFYKCSSLTSVTIPESVTTIGQYAFYGCGAGELIVNCNIIPYASRDYEGAFYASNFTSVTIGDGVTEIGSHAFMHCNNLTSITIPDSVTTIGDSAFAYCYDLTSVTIPDSVTTIGNFAFVRCDSLTSVTIPDSVTTIGQEAFSDCSSLTSVYISDISAWCNISFSDWDSNPLSYAHNLYLNNELVTDLTIPDSVTDIGNYAFYNSNFSSVLIRENVSSIGEYAFYNCAFTNVKFENGVSYIANNAFSNCENFMTVYFLNTADLTLFSQNALQSANNIYDVHIDCNIPADAANNTNNSFYGICLSEGKSVNIIIGQNAKNASVVGLGTSNTIGKNAFYNCLGINMIELYNIKSSNISGYSIGSNAFYNCTSELILHCSISKNNGFSNAGFKKINILNTVSSIGDNAFSNCASIKSVYYYGTLKGWCDINFGNSSANPLSNGNSGLYVNNELVTDIEIGNHTNVDEIFNINKYAFYRYKQLKSVYYGSATNGISVPNTSKVITIGDYAFYLSSTDKTNVTRNVYISWKNSTSENNTSPLQYYCSCIDFKDINSNPIINKLYINTSTSTNAPAFVELTDLNLAKLNGWKRTYSASKMNRSTAGINIIKKYAFSNCKSLQSVTIAEYVNTGTTGNQYYSFIRTAINPTIYDGDTDYDDYVTDYYDGSPYAGFTIEQDVFKYCTNINKIVVSNNTACQKIAIQQWCGVTLENKYSHPLSANTSNKGFCNDSGTSLNNIEIFPRYALSGIGNSSTETYYISQPSGWQKIYDYGVHKHSNAYIKPYVFCNTIKSVDTTVRICSYASKGNNNNINENYTSISINKIDSSAFEGCSTLKTLIFDIGSSLNNRYTSHDITCDFGENAFRYANGIERVILPSISNGSKAFRTWGYMNFNNAYSNPLCCGYAKLCYGTATSNKKLVGTDIIYGQSTTGDKARDLFFEASSTSSNKKISPYAFYNAYAYLSSTDQPDSIILKNITEIGEYAFYGMPIKNLVISDECVSIGNSAFKDCTDIENIQIGSSDSCSLDNIGADAFKTTSQCNSLKKFVVFKNVNIYKQAETESNRTLITADDIFTNRGDSENKFTIYCTNNTGIWFGSSFKNIANIASYGVTNTKKWYGFKNNNSNTAIHWTDIGTDYDI